MLAAVFARTQPNQEPGVAFEQLRGVSARIVGQVARYVTEGRWLDVGFADGSLLFTAEEWGFEPQGLDLRPGLVGKLRQLGIPARVLPQISRISLAFWGLIRSPWGRAFVAVRENPMRALSLGVDTRRYTLIAFALGAGLGGISGVLLAQLVQFIDPSPFSLTASLNLLLMVVSAGPDISSGRLSGRLSPSCCRNGCAFPAGFISFAMRSW